MIEIRHVPVRSRYEIREDDQPVGFVEYVRDGNVLDFVHTEIDSAYGGKGMGGKLVAGALADVKASGLRVKPTCPFVAKYFDKHPEYAELRVG